MVSHPQILLTRRLKEPGQKIRKFGKGKAKEQGALLFNLEEEATS